jgi:hypothetical protein
MQNKRVKELLERQLGEQMAIHLSSESAILRLEEKIAGVKEGMEAWVGFRFQSSSGLTEEFAAFDRDYRSWVKKNLPKGSALVAWSRGHFECSGFIERAGRFVYFHTSDVRFFPDGWYNDILVRTAKSTKDYTGGMNQSTPLSRFTQVVDSLLKRED